MSSLYTPFVGFALPPHLACFLPLSLKVSIVYLIVAFSLHLVLELLSHLGLQSARSLRGESELVVIPSPPLALLVLSEVEGSEAEGLAHEGSAGA